MDDVLFKSYLHDFVYTELSIHIKQPSFLFNLMSDIKEKGEAYLKDSSTVPSDILVLHFQFGVHRTLIKNCSTILKLLNEVDMLLDYDSQRLNNITPIAMLGDSEFNKLCHYVLRVIYTLFSNSVGEHSNDDIDKWNMIYATMVSAWYLLDYAMAILTPKM